MIIQLYNPKTIDLISNGTSGLCLRIGDGSFANRVELWFKDQKEFEEFKKSMPGYLVPLKGSTNA